MNATASIHKNAARIKKAGDVVWNETVSGIRFAVTEEVWRDIGNGKMHCIASGETIDKTELDERGKGTRLEVIPRG